MAGPNEFDARLKEAWGRHDLQGALDVLHDAVSAGRLGMRSQCYEVARYEAETVDYEEAGEKAAATDAALTIAAGIEGVPV